MSRDTRAEAHASSMRSTAESGSLASSYVSAAYVNQVEVTLAVLQLDNDEPV